MGRRQYLVGLAILLASSSRTLNGEIVDRISVIVGNRIIKQSDIERDIRVVGFLNHTEPNFGARSRKEAASRLIDQEIMRQEMQSTGASPAPMDDANRLLAQLKKDRFKTDTDFRQALAHYGIDEQELKSALLWQLTVLRFIEQRFPTSVESTKDAADRENANFEAWMDQNRKETSVEYREESLK